MADKGGNVRVVVRFRPQSESELTHGGVMISNVDGAGRSVTIDGQRKAAFTFDRVFGPDSKQEELYDFSARPVVEDVLKGYNGTIFAYGQTSSGKTHTMEGPDIDGPERGIIPRIVQNIFQYIELAPESLEFTVRVSYFEIYMEKIRDLLCDGNDNLQIHENRERGVYVRHATELFMQDTEEVMEVMRSGADRRSVASTNMNDISSRSHSVFQMEITQKDTIKGGVKQGRLYLVDLAGSEKVSKTGADGEVLEEAKNINKSLSALGLVIMSLTDGQPRHHVPYRDSKLTRILQESLGGNSRTTIIICCSPSSYNEQETFSSLRFGKRAKNIKNNAVVNVQYSAEELQKQLDAAKKDLKRMAKLLAAAEAELQLWRSGQTVSEEDRVALSNNAAAAAEGGGSATATLEGGEATGAAQGSALSDQEREEFLKRETELLDMLDDKDEHVRTMEREIEILSKDKVVITTLASENSALRSKVKELEEQNDEFLAETTEYEVTIEDMARANQEMQELSERYLKEKEAVEAALQEQMEEFEKTVTSVSDSISNIFTSKPGEQKRAEVSTAVDGQLAKARAFVTSLQNEIAQSKKLRAEIEEEVVARKAAEEKLEGDLKELRAAVAQGERKTAEANQRLAQTSQKYDDLRAEKQTLEAQLLELTSNLSGVQNELLVTKRDAGSKEDAKTAEIRLVLERQKEQQLQQHAEQINVLQKQLDELQNEKFALSEEKEKLSLMLDQLKGDLDKKAAQLTQANEKLETQEKKVQQEQAVRQETQLLTEQTTRQLDNCEALKSKMRESLMQRLKSMGAPAGAAAGGAEKAPATSAYVTSLEKTTKELQSSLQEAQKNLSVAQREALASEKHLQAKTERIKNLEALLKGSEERFQRFMDNQQQLSDARKNAERSQLRNVVRKKSAKPVEPKPTTVQRTGRSDADQTKTDFWKEQASSTRPSVSGRHNLVNQGAPMVGQYASPAAAAAAPAPAKQNPLSVEFV